MTFAYLVSTQNRAVDIKEANKPKGEQFQNVVNVELFGMRVSFEDSFQDQISKNDFYCVVDCDLQLPDWLCMPVSQRWRQECVGIGRKVFFHLVLGRVHH